MPFLAQGILCPLSSFTPDIYLLALFVLVKSYHSLFEELLLNAERLDNVP